MLTTQLAETSHNALERVEHRTYNDHDTLQFVRAVMIGDQLRQNPVQQSMIVNMPAGSSMPIGSMMPTGMTTMSGSVGGKAMTSSAAANRTVTKGGGAAFSIQR